MVNFTVKDELPRSAWFVRKVGRLIAGLQYDPECKFVVTSRFPKKYQPWTEIYNLLDCGFPMCRAIVLEARAQGSELSDPELRLGQKLLGFWRIRF